MGSNQGGLVGFP